MSAALRITCPTWSRGVLGKTLANRVVAFVAVVTMNVKEHVVARVVRVIVLLYRKHKLT